MDGAVSAKGVGMVPTNELVYIKKFCRRPPYSGIILLK